MAMPHGRASGGEGFHNIGVHEKQRKAKAAAKCAASQSSMKTVEEEPRSQQDSWMEVDADASSTAAASEVATSSAAAAAAAAASTSTLQSVVAIRGTSREPKGSGSVKALPGRSVPKGDSEGNLGMKRKGKLEANAET
eukprot:4746293-Amphidinium_carterae.1